jgi:hypothetical protein
MFDLSLAHLDHAERERRLAADLRGRQILKAAEATPAAQHAPLPRQSPQRSVKRARALGR